MPDLIVTNASARMRIRQVLTDRGVHAATVLLWVIDQYGNGIIDDKEDDEDYVLNWHPLTFKAELEEDYGIPKLPQHTIDRLMAAIAVRKTDFFFRDLRRFLPLATVLAGDPFDSSIVSLPPVIDLTWAIAEALLINPPDNDQEANTYFSDEIRSYLGAALRDEGFIQAPDLLGIALGADFSKQVTSNYSDDPELSGGIWQVQQQRTDEVHEALKYGFESLLEQLQALPFRHGTATGFAKQVAAMLHRETTSGELDG